MIFLILAGNSKVCNTESSLITKKRKLTKTFLYLFLGTFQFLSFICSLTLSKMSLPIFKYLAMFKCASISKYQFSFALLADNLLVKLTSKVSFYLSWLAQTINQIVEIIISYQLSNFSSKLLISFKSYIISLDLILENKIGENIRSCQKNYININNIEYME